LTLSQSIEKLQHFQINFDGKNQCKIVTFDNFEMPLVAMVTGNLNQKAMVQSTFVPSLISINAVFIVL
jgi:hypothetical protein